MKKTMHLALASATLALMTLVPAAALASAPSTHDHSPVVHDRTPRVHDHGVRIHHN